MIKSQFILNLLDLLLDGDDDSRLARLQIAYLSESKNEYTGAGVFIYFSHTDQIANHKLNKSDLVLLGVIIKSPDLTAGAEANLFFKDGIIHNLEIWSQDGQYPQKELTNYTITQEWNGSPRRQTVSDNKTSA